MTDQSDQSSALKAVYQQQLLALFRNPLGTGTPSQNARRGWAKNRSCGDEVTFHSLIDLSTVTQCWQETAGCAISTATASLLVKELADKTIEESEALLKRIRETVYEGSDPEPREDWKILSAIHALPSRHECVGVALRAAEQSLLSSKESP